MNFNKCERCGCFFVTDSIVCPKCQPKDNFEISKLKDYLTCDINLTSIDTICENTGISERNLNRYLKYDEFVNLLNDNDSIPNLKMNL